MAYFKGTVTGKDRQQCIDRMHLASETYFGVDSDLIKFGIYIGGENLVDMEVIETKNAAQNVISEQLEFSYSMTFEAEHSPESIDNGVND